LAVAAVVGAIALVVVGGALVGSAAATPPDALDAAKSAAARYHSIDQAQAAGYVAGSPCEQLPAVGGMGFHYVNPALLADPAIDPAKPEVLLYAPNEQGKLKLVGVEYVAVALANTPAGPAPWFGATSPPVGFFNPAPMLFGQTFDGPMAGHGPGMPWHYDLHVWLYRANPSGMFAQWNSNVSCS
jgi:hypothetical protein